MSKPKAFLYDLDGTTYHMNGKRKFYDHNVDVDDPDPIVQAMVRQMSNLYIPIAMSGRVESTRAKTLDSLHRDLVPVVKLFMRADGDYRRDDIVKRELYDNHIRDNYAVQFVIDDRWQVCKMWLEMGLKVFNVSGLDRGEF